MQFSIIPRNYSLSQLFFILFALSYAPAIAQQDEVFQYTPGGFFDQPYDHYGTTYALHALNIRNFNLDSLVANGEGCIEPIVEGEGIRPRSLIKPTLQQAETALTIYPNPAKDLVIVEFAPAGIAHIELVDNTGKVVQKTAVSLTQNQFSLNLNKLVSGLYGIRLVSESGAVIGQSKIIKQ